MAVLLSASDCGGSSGTSPTSPSSPTSTGSTQGGGSGPAPACRTYATADRRSLTSSAGVSGTITDACSAYNRTTNEQSCTLNYNDSRGTAYTSNSTVKFAAIADFVGDAPRVFIYSTATMHPASATTTTSGVTINSTYTYDTQGRLTRLANQLSTGVSDILTFTTWDSFGRPTAASSTSTTFRYAYDDTARTATITNGQGGTITQTFDQNGILVSQISTTQGGGTETQVWTTQSTETTCR